MAASGMQAATLPVTNPLLLLLTDTSASFTAVVAHAPLATEARLDKAEEKLKEAKVELEKADVKLEKAEEKLKEAKAELKEAKVELEKADVKLKEAKAELKEAPDEEAKARAKMAIDSAQERVKSAQELVSAFTHVVARLVASSAGSCAWHGLFISFMVCVSCSSPAPIRDWCYLCVAHIPPSLWCASTACVVSVEPGLRVRGYSDRPVRVVWRALAGVCVWRDVACPCVRECHGLFIMVRAYSVPSFCPVLRGVVRVWCLCCADL